MGAVTQLSMICLGDEIFCCYWRGRILLATIYVVKSFLYQFQNSFRNGVQLLLICREDEIVLYYWRGGIICICNYLSLSPSDLNLKKSYQFSSRFIEHQCIRLDYFNCIHHAIFASYRLTYNLRSLKNIF